MTWIADDDCEDQGMAPTDRCTKSECYKLHYSSLEGNPRWHGPKLVLSGKFWCCPSCGASYGEHAKEGLQKSLVT